MKRNERFYAVIIIVTILMFGGSIYKVTKEKTINNKEIKTIKSSIVNLHKDYVKNENDIKIIDEFNYVSDKVVLFNYKDLTGYATFIKCENSEFKIAFVETINKKNVRKTSKAT